MLFARDANIVFVSESLAHAEGLLLDEKERMERESNANEVRMQLVHVRVPVPMERMLVVCVSVGDEVITISCI